jgi:hypothetical protein
VLTELADGRTEDGPGSLVPQEAAAFKLAIVKRLPKVDRRTIGAGNASCEFANIQWFVAGGSHRDINKLARRRSLVNVSIMDPAGGTLRHAETIRARSSGRRAVDFDANAEVFTTTPDQLRQVGDG